MPGYIKLYRSMLDHLDMPAAALKIWLFLLLRARFRPGDGLVPGEVLTTYREIIDTCSEAGAAPMARTTVARALDYLEREQMIRRHTDRPGRPLRITIINWQRYQGDETCPDGDQAVADHPDGGTSSATSSETSSLTLQVAPETETSSDTLQPTLQVALQVEPGNPVPVRPSGHGKNDKNDIYPEDEEEEAVPPEAKQIHDLFVELTGRMPSARDLTMIAGAIKDVRDAGIEDPTALLERAMRHAAAAFKPTRLDPRPHDFRYFVGWIRRAIQDEVAKREVASRDQAIRTHTRRPEPAGVNSSGRSKWVDPAAYE